MAVIINGVLVEIVALPDQTGHAGQALVTDGTSADWAALAGTGDMTKATYDPNNDGIVNQAAVVNDGAGNSKTAAQIKTHIDSTSNPHNVTAAQVGAAATPSGTGMVHVTAGVQDGASKLVVNADVDAGAAIAESKLSLNNPTHSNANDPSSDQKNALVGTNGTPYSGNRYVTDSDPRNTNTRTPVAHGSAQHTGTIGTPTQVGLGNVSNVDTTNATNITSGTLPAARLPAMSAGAKGGVPATGAPSGKYLKDDGTWDSPAGAGDMAKATYDTTNNSIVDKAETVDDGAGNSATAAAIKTALTTTIPGKADLVAGATNGHLAGLDAGGNLTDSGNEPADFAPAAKGVTDGDSHDHTGGAGAAITEDALSLSNVTTGDVDNTKHGFCPITPNDTDKYLRGDATWAIPPSGGSPPSGTGWRHVTAGVEDAASSTPTKTDVGLGNVKNLDQTDPANITQDATHRMPTDAQISGWNAKLDPAGSGANLTGIPEGALSFTNITTNDVSTTKHGLTPRAPNDATKFLRGDASWAVPSAGSASWPLVTSKSEISPGDTGYATLDAILAGPPATGTSILLQSGNHTLHASNDRTLPVGVNLRALPGARIVIPSGRTFTVNGHIEAGAYQIFTDNSAAANKGVKFTYAEMVYPEWWGADPSGAVTSHTAFQLASQSFLYGGVILCTNIYYKFTASATLAAGTCVQGVNALEPTFTNTSGVCIQASGDFPTFILNNDVKLHGILFLSTALANAPAMVYSAAEIRRVNIEKCLFEGNWNAPFTACMYFPGNIHDSKFVNNKTYQTYTFLKGHTLDCIIKDNQPGGPLSGGATQVWQAATSATAGDYLRPTLTKIGVNRYNYPWMYWALNSGTTHATTEPTWPTFIDDIYVRTFEVTASGKTFTLTAGSWDAAYNDGSKYLYFNGGANNGLHHVASASGANLLVEEDLVAEASPVTYTVCPTVLENAGASQIRWAAVPAPIGFNIDGQVQLMGNWMQGFWAGIVPDGTLSGIIAKNTFIQNLGYGVYAAHDNGHFDQCSIGLNIFDGSSNVGIDGWWSDNSTYLSLMGNTFAGWLGYGLNMPATNGYVTNGPNNFYNNTAGNENFLAANSWTIDKTAT